MIKYLKIIWKVINGIQPETRSLIIILLFGYILYTQITSTTKQMIKDKFKEELMEAREAEKYSIKTSIELNRQIQLISEMNENAFNVLLLNYHNNTQSLQGYKYLYLSCLTEAPKTLDTPPIRQQWNRIDYVYYADELAKIHNQGYLNISDINQMKESLPKLYRLVKASEANAVSFFTIEGHDSEIGMIIILYKDFSRPNYKNILPCIQRLAIILDYDNVKK